MSTAVRRAGTATLADGSEVVWSVADGRRGRRWRAVTRRRGTLTASLLLEVGTDGRPARLELATAAGLLTLHPEPTGALHGNAITPAGVRHLTLTWSDQHELEVEPPPISGAVTVHRLARLIPVGKEMVLPVIAVGADLSVREASRRYSRLGAPGWHVEGDGETWRLTVDERGLPAWPETAGAPGGAGEWPLEPDPQD